MKTQLVGTRKAINNWLRQFKTIIDFESKRYKIQESLLSIFKWGIEKPLPTLNYVLIFKSVFVKCEGCDINEFENNPYSYFQISLVHNNNRKIIVHETRKQEEAFSIAKTLADNLQLKIKDAATNRREATWLN